MQKRNNLRCSVIYRYSSDIEAMSRSGFYTHDYFSALAFLVGNKRDLERSVPEDSVVDFAEAHGLEGIFDVSAKTGAYIYFFF